MFLSFFACLYMNLDLLVPVCDSSLVLLVVFLCLVRMFESLPLCVCVRFLVSCVLYFIWLPLVWLFLIYSGCVSDLLSPVLVTLRIYCPSLPLPFVVSSLFVVCLLSSCGVIWSFWLFLSMFSLKAENSCFLILLVELYHKICKKIQM